jgi:hypothetical protein
MVRVIVSCRDPCNAVGTDSRFPMAFLVQSVYMGRPLWTPRSIQWLHVDASALQDVLYFEMDCTVNPPHFLLEEHMDATSFSDIPALPVRV